MTPADVDNVNRLLASEMLAQGPFVAEMQAELARRTGSTGVALTSSGAMAIRNSLLALGVRSGTQVALPTYVCPSVLWAVESTGADPILLDCSGQWTLTPNDLDQALARGAQIYIRVHTFGIDGSLDGASGTDLITIDDKAQALPLRIVSPGMAAVYSFSATKYITTGEGGAVASEDSSFLERFTSIQGLGIRFSDLAAQLGVSQLRSLTMFVERRESIARRYLNDLPPELTVQTRIIDGRTCYFRFPITVRDPEPLMRKFAADGIAVRRGVDSLLHRSLGLSDSEFPNATCLFNSTLSLPIYPGLTASEQDLIIETAWKVTSGSA